MHLLLKGSHIHESSGVCVGAWGEGIVALFFFFRGFGANRETERTGAPGCWVGMQKWRGKGDPCLGAVSGHRCCSGAGAEGPEGAGACAFRLRGRDAEVTVVARIEKLEVGVLFFWH